MDRYIDIKKRIIEYAGGDEDIKVIIAIGSSTRKEVKADEYSDLDLIIVSENVNRWCSGEYPNMLGDVKISFIEPTLGGGKERRCIYDEDRDVDMIIFTQSQFEEALKVGGASWVMNRGYDILYDAIAIEKEIEIYVKKGHSNPNITAEEFENMLNDFYFHNIWASKMNHCFAHYEKTDVLNALKATNSLFEELTRKIAAKKGYIYPDKAGKCAEEYLEKMRYKRLR